MEPERSAPAGEETEVLRTELQIPSDVVSQYANHVTIHTRFSDDDTSDVTISFWQIPAFSRPEGATAQGVLLGSYVMPKLFAERLVSMLGDHLGLSVRAKGDDDG